MSEHKMPLREFADRVPAHFKSTGEEHAWLAGYEAAREQAARVADDYSEAQRPTRSLHEEGRRLAGEDLAAAIRAMTPAPDGRQENPAPRTDTEPR